MSKDLKQKESRPEVGNTNPLYTNDVLHCREEQCPKKQKCYRYWLYQENLKHQYTNLVWMYRPEEPPEDCDQFINIGK